MESSRIKLVAAQILTRKSSESSSLKLVVWDFRIGVETAYKDYVVSF
jgi:hypothetical protein